MDGCIGAMPVGGTVGGAMGASAGKFHADVQPHHLLIEAAHILAVPVAAGLMDFRTYTQKYPLTGLITQPDPALQPPPLVRPGQS